MVDEAAATWPTGPNSETTADSTAPDRYAEAAEIAATVDRLASPDGAYITGAPIHVDGGFTA
ncbi:SDR family oxidoreductase [Streptomyces sp. WAC 00631]|uniref:SDR family oxidoreductase n=2 Tax=unclassified Streptomyces TaxID=2593676 RepID=UPI002684C31E|nr:SDR family oxidoreductase [Streptomyces sp. WAC 00631]